MTRADATAEPVIRRAARVLLIDSVDRILLLAARDPADGRVVWFVPGGGVENDEALLQAAVRELAEEIPLVGEVELRGPVWKRQHDFTWAGRRIIQTEWYFVGRLRAPLEAAEIRLSGPEERFFERAQWVSVEELAGWPSTTIMAPRRLAELLGPILAGVLPHEPIDTGV